MKKSLLALAVLGAFAGAASAQSSVTLYGRVDLAVGKGVGLAQKAINNGSGSRFGVRGVEDLGGGLQALFQIEHRFDADTGASQNFNVTTASGATNANRFWGARSIVGLKGGFGQVLLGREYTTAFLMSQLAADPWGWDTIVSGTPGTGLNQVITGGGIARVRNDSAVTYNLSVGGFAFGAQVSEATDTINGFQKKPFNFAATYKAGPFSVGFGYEKTGQVAAASAKWMTVNAAFDLGMVKLGGLYGTGNTAANADNKSYLLTAVAPMGQGELRASYGKADTDPAGATPTANLAKGFGLGYHYALSKRTTVYVDYARNTALTTQKTGYDFGIKHNF